MKGAGQSTANLVDYSVLYDQTVRATLWNEVSIYTHASLAVTCTQEVHTYTSLQLPVHIRTYFINPRACVGLRYSSCRSFCQSVCYPRWLLQNDRNSETTGSIPTKRDIGIGSIAFSDIILLKSLSKKREA